MQNRLNLCGAYVTPLKFLLAGSILFVWLITRSIAMTLLAAVLQLAAYLVLRRRFLRSLNIILEGVERYAGGDFGRRIEVADFPELPGLADTINRMAIELDDRIGTVTRQRSERDAVFSSMREGLIALDQEQKIIRFNLAAFDMLGLENKEVRNHAIDQVLPDGPLLSFIKRNPNSEVDEEEELVVHNLGYERYLHAYRKSLREESGLRRGVLIVLNDITRLHQLENMRREFVANVSHELKTPITSIKGFVETLVDGALDNREDALRFLGIIARQAERLNAIIEDLLSLSRIEEEKDKGEIKLEQGNLSQILLSATQVCEFKAKEKNVRIDLVCDPALLGMINPALLEQAVVNLVDNAVKYSESGDVVTVTGYQNETELCVKVADQGRGIEKPHLSRLFERFYRVDKARSRKEGGTGLGLAIVKHIAQAHGGYPSAESTPGKGSTFCIHLPARSTPLAS